MKPITIFVREYINKRPFLRAELNSGLINISALAELMLPDIERSSGKTLKRHTIASCIKGMILISDNVRIKQSAGTLINILEITMRASISVLTFEKSTRTVESLMHFENAMFHNGDPFHSISSGLHFTNILINSSYDHIANESFETTRKLQHRKGLASITARLSKNGNVNAEIYYYFFQRLSWENVTVFEVTTSSNEFTAYIPESDLAIAFSIFQDIKRGK